MRGNRRDIVGRRAGTRSTGSAVLTPAQAAAALLTALGSTVKLMLDFELGATTAQWDDQSGNSNHATQSTAGYKPTYSAVTGFTFAAGKGFALPNADLVAGAFTTGLNFTLDDATVAGLVAYAVAFKHNTALFGGSFFTELPGYTEVTILANVAGALLPHDAVGFSPTLDTSQHTRISTWNGGADPTTAANYTGKYDGVTKTITASGAVALTETNLPSLGCRMDSAGLPAFSLIGKLKRVIVCDTALSAPNQALVNTWLAR